MSGLISQESIYGGPVKDENSSQTDLDISIFLFLHLQNTQILLHDGVS